MTETINLASARLGAKPIRATDEFFAPLQRMLQDSDAVFIDDKFDDHGKWMDGWETRRRRRGGHDWSVIQLALPGTIDSIDIDTSHFTGNYPPAVSIEGILSESEPNDQADWQQLVAPQAVNGNSHNMVDVDSNAVFNYLRIHIYPDGGIARLRVYGHVFKDWNTADTTVHTELSALSNGGRIVGYNDAHYGNVSALLSAGRADNMGDGWETRRRREPGHDWIIITLGTAGLIDTVEVDTAHFKGNFPDKCALQAALVQPGLPSDAIITQSQFWPEIMAQQPLSADAIHQFDDTDIHCIEAVSHVRFNIYPDGGVSRLRLFGTPSTNR